MRIITESGAQNVISISPQPKQMREVLEPHVQLVKEVEQKCCSVLVQMRWRWKCLVIQNNSTLQTINCIHQNH